VLCCADWSLRDPGYKVALSPAPVVRALHGRHLSSGGKSVQMSGAQFCFLAEDSGTKGALSQKLCCFCSKCALLPRLVSQRPGIQDGSLTCSGGQSPPWMPPLLWCEKSLCFSFKGLLAVSFVPLYFFKGVIYIVHKILCKLHDT